jgi:hypothetical protein
MIGQLQKGIIVAAVLGLGVFITACGGSGGGSSLAGGGIGGTGVTSGTVSGFGSVFVNGIEFATDGASRDVDDVIDISDGRDDNTVLGIGMVVTITGTVNADGVTGTAESIVYDDDVEGPVGAIVADQDMVTKTFAIFRTTVVVDRNTTVFVSTDYGSLAENDLLEVSGYFGADGVLQATRVEKNGVLVPGVSNVEIKGEVSGFNGIDTFMLDDISVRFDAATTFEDLPGTVQNGQFVEVQGTLETVTSIAARRIELEEGGFGNDVDEISLEGIVTDFNGSGDFRVAGQRVNAANATFEPAALLTSIANNAKVEIEGSIVDGILQAREVEQRGGDVRVSAIVVSKNSLAGTVTLQVVSGQPYLTISSNSQTQIEDKRDEEEPFSIDHIDAGDYLNVEGYVDSNGGIVATQIEREEAGDIELHGPADVPPTLVSNLAGVVSIFGIEIVTDGSTEFEDADEASIRGDDFGAQVNDADRIAFEDDFPANGIADEVEFED